MVASHKLKKLTFKKTILANRRRRELIEKGIACALLQHHLMIKACILSGLLLFSQNDSRATAFRSCRRLKRNYGWWELAWHTYDEERFKRTFRVCRKTFMLILDGIRCKIEKQTLCEEPISPVFRLGLCLYRLGRGDYFFTISELSGLAPCTVSTIVNEVNKAIVSCLWKKCVASHLTATDDAFRKKMLDLEEHWQFPFSWCAVDGCHIPIKCPSGGQEACREYHNFKNFYSIVLMSMVDAKYRFVWGSCGYPGNSHDSIIFQSTAVWSSIKDGKFLPKVTQKEEGVSIPPLILGDSAFLLETYLMKPCTNTILSKEQRYFNYRLSRARLVVEGAYGQLKGRWRLLLRKSEGNLYQTKMATLAFMVLHNLCLENNDELSIQQHTRRGTEKQYVTFY